MQGLICAHGVPIQWLIRLQIPINRVAGFGPVDVEVHNEFCDQHCDKNGGLSAKDGQNTKRTYNVNTRVLRAAHMPILLAPHDHRSRLQKEIGKQMLDLQRRYQQQYNMKVVHRPRPMLALLIRD